MSKIKVKAKAPLSGVTTHVGALKFDPRYDPRVKEQERIGSLRTTVEPRNTQDVPSVSLVDYEGYPFITSMADRTAAGGVLTGINDVALKRPIDLQGGQGYMFENPGQVWASGENPVRQLMLGANAMKAITGKDPLYMPWRMAPTGGDFAHMTGETMLSFAESNMGSKAKRSLDKQIRQFIPDWKGVDSPDSFEQYRQLPDAARKALKNIMDVNFREEGGLNIGEARLSVADPKQIDAPEAHIMNVGRIFADKPIIEKSGHVSYPHGVPGEGIGVIDQPRSVFELLPEYAKERGIPDPSNPRQTDIRSMQMKPYMGIITEELLKSIGYADGGMVDSAPEEAIKNTIRDPQAYRMLDIDLANLALMNQPQRMANGGVAHMDEGGLLQNAFRAFVPAQVRTFVGTLAGDESPITEKNFSGDELAQMRDAIMSSRRDRTATNARLYHEALQNAATAKDRQAIRAKGISPELDQTVGYQHYPGSPTDLASDFSLSSDKAIRNTLGRFAYNKDAEGNLIATDLYKFRNDQSDKTRPTSDYADMGTARKLGTLAYDTFTGAGIETLPSRIGNAFLGNKPGRPVMVNLGKAPFAVGGSVKKPTPEEMLIELMERGYAKA